MVIVTLFNVKDYDNDLAYSITGSLVPITIPKHGAMNITVPAYLVEKGVVIGFRTMDGHECEVRFLKRNYPKGSIDEITEFVGPIIGSLFSTTTCIVSAIFQYSITITVTVAILAVFASFISALLL